MSYTSFSLMYIRQSARLALSLFFRLLIPNREIATGSETVSVSQLAKSWLASECRLDPSNGPSWDSDIRANQESGITANRDSNITASQDPVTTASWDRHASKGGSKFLYTSQQSL